MFPLRICLDRLAIPSFSFSGADQEPLQHPARPRSNAASRNDSDPAHGHLDALETHQSIAPCARRPRRSCSLLLLLQSQRGHQITYAYGLRAGGKLPVKADLFSGHRSTQLMQFLGWHTCGWGRLRGRSSGVRAEPAGAAWSGLVGGSFAALLCRIAC